MSLHNEQLILSKLIELQNFDNEILDLEKQYYSIPSSLESIRNKIQHLNDHVDQLTLQSKEKHQHLEDLQQETKDAEESLEKNQSRLMEVKTNREYDAILNEIESGQIRIKKHHESMLTTQDEIQKLEKELEKSQAERDKYSEEYQPILDELTTKYQGIKVDFEAKQEIRKQKIKEIPKAYLTRYERVRKGTDGRVVVKIIRNSACGGCCQALPKQKLNEIRRNSHVIHCEYCGRILYWEDE
ncbi:MAG: hypothetical protein KBA26_04395 [Candidatus Delongbacteria bacterium]|nr:hypothetical protein [Candidatus Delongbacteria bacterium]